MSSTQKSLHLVCPTEWEVRNTEKGHHSTIWNTHIGVSIYIYICVCVCAHMSYMCRVYMYVHVRTSMPTCVHTLSCGTCICKPASSRMRLAATGKQAFNRCSRSAFHFKRTPHPGTLSVSTCLVQIIVFSWAKLSDLFFLGWPPNQCTGNPLCRCSLSNQQPGVPEDKKQLRARTFP